MNHDCLTWVDSHDGDCRDAAHLLWRLPGGRKRRSAGGGGILEPDRAAELREMEKLRIEHKALIDKVAQLEVVVSAVDYFRLEISSGAPVDSMHFCCLISNRGPLPSPQSRVLSPTYPLSSGKSRSSVSSPARPSERDALGSTQCGAGRCEGISRCLLSNAWVWVSSVD